MKKQGEMIDSVKGEWKKARMWLLRDRVEQEENKASERTTAKMERLMERLDRAV